MGACHAACATDIGRTLQTLATVEGIFRVRDQVSKTLICSHIVQIVKRESKGYTHFARNSAHSGRIAALRGLESLHRENLLVQWRSTSSSTCQCDVPRPGTCREGSTTCWTQTRKRKPTWIGCGASNYSIAGIAPHYLTQKCPLEALALGNMLMKVPNPAMFSETMLHDNPDQRISEDIDYFTRVHEASSVT
eukprot:5623222-Amphidinium_carterae.2